jgi:hypothetical protein
MSTSCIVADEVAVKTETDYHSHSLLICRACVVCQGIKGKYVLLRALKYKIKKGDYRTTQRLPRTKCSYKALLILAPRNEGPSGNSLVFFLSRTVVNESFLDQPASLARFTYAVGTVFLK